METSIGIAAEAYYLPETKKKVSDVFRDEDIPFGTLAKNIDFRRDIGIEEIHVTEELASALALKAVQKTLLQAGMSGSDIDFIIDFTSVPQDYIGPTWSAAGFIQKEIGAQKAFSTAITTGGCASYHFALKTACAIMTAEPEMEIALLFAGDRTPRFNKTYYPITVASDGGSALILKKGSERGKLLALDTISIGRLHDVWYVPGLGHRKSDTSDLEKLLHMHCDMKKFNDGVIPVNFFMFKKIVKHVLEMAQKTLEDIDVFIYPNFSTWDQDYFSKAIGMARERVYTKRLKERGHVQESDMVINYADAVADNVIKKGSLVMVISNGAGFAWSAALVQH